jgi:hypothetical protein
VSHHPSLTPQAGQSPEAKLVALGALAFAALGAVLVTGGRARVVAATGGGAMCVAAAWSMFAPRRLRP